MLYNHLPLHDILRQVMRWRCWFSFCTHTAVDWLNLILLKTNGEGEQVTFELCIAWSLIIHFLSPARNRAGRLPLLPPLFQRIDRCCDFSTYDWHFCVTCLILTSLCDLSLHVTATWFKGVTAAGNSGIKINHPTFHRSLIRVRNQPNKIFDEDHHWIIWIITG